MKVKMAYGCQIKMAKKSDEEDKNNPEKKGRGSDLWHIMYERKK